MKFKADYKYIHYLAQNIIKEDTLFFYCKNPNRDLYRSTLEYEHMRKNHGFSLRTITAVTHYG